MLCMCFRYIDIIERKLKKCCRLERFFLISIKQNIIIYTIITIEYLIS